MKSKLRKMVNKTKTQAVVSRKANLKTKQLSHVREAEYKEADNGHYPERSMKQTKLMVRITLTVMGIVLLLH